HPQPAAHRHLHSFPTRRSSDLGTLSTDISVIPSTAWGTLAADVITPTGYPLGLTTTAMTFTVNSGSGNIGAYAANDLICFGGQRSEEHTSELQSQSNLVCRLLL